MSTMGRYRRQSLWAIVAGTLVLALGVAFAPGLKPSGAADPQESAPDPIPLQRVLIAPDRVPQELERVRKGVLVQLTRDDFEARVQRAAQVGEALKYPPRLVEARYRASLLEQALVGTAQWKVVNPAPLPGILAIQPLNLALQKARLQKAQFDTTEAILGDLDGKGLGLLVEQSGEHAAFLDWTAAGEVGPGGLRFNLQVPACAIASLELNLPADRLLAASQDGYLLSGPHPAEAENRRLWRLEFAGQTKVDLVVRAGRSGGPGQPPPLVLSRLQTRQDLKSDQVAADFDFNLEVTELGVRELQFDCDPALWPYEVNVRGLETWETRPPAQPGKPSTLVVHLREPFQGGSLQLRCLACAGRNQPWTCPGVRLAGALPRGETLVVRVAPDVVLEDWQPGSFRLTKSKTEADGGLVLTLLGNGLTSGTDPRRPSAHVQLPRAEVRCRQAAWWQIGSRASTLTTQITYDVVRGKLFRLPVRLPLGHEVERVEMAPPDLLRHWTVVAEKAGSSLIVDLQKALGPAAAAPARLSVWLRSSQPGMVGAPGITLPIPDPVPQASCLREGLLGISVDPLFQANVQASVLPTSVAERGPWGRQVPDYAFSFWGQAVSGTVNLKPRRPQVRAQCSTEVVLATGRASALACLVLQPGVGNPDTIDVAASAPMGSSWTWKTRHGQNRVRRVERLTSIEAAQGLGALAARTPFQGLAALAQLPPRGGLWRLTLAKPLRESLTLEANLDIGLPSAGKKGPLPGQVAPLGQAGPGPDGWTWDVPLLSVTTAERSDGEVTLYLAGADLVRLESQGLLEVPGAALGGALSPWRAFRYGPAPAALTLHGRVLASDHATDMVVDRAHVTTVLEPGGRLVQHLAMEVWSRRQQVLALRLPTGCRPLAAKVEGRWIAQLEPYREGGLEGVVEFPVRAGPEFRHFDIFYESNSACHTWGGRVHAPVPELPVRVLAYRHSWRLPPGMAPVAEGELRLPDTDAEGWTEWEPLTVSEGDGSLLVVRTDLVAWTSLGLAMLLAGAAWLARTWSRGVRFRLLMAWVVSGGLAWLWLPASLRGLAWWPTITGMAIVILWNLRSASLALSHRGRAGATVAGLLVLVFLGSGFGGRAGPSDPVTVFLLPVQAEAPGKQAVLAPKDLLDQLDALSRRGVAGLRQPVLVAARYEGQVNGAGADVKAEYQVYGFTDEPAALTLPLAGVQLKEALVDGAPANPVSLRPPREGYTLEVKGRGPHTVRLTFAGQVTSSGEDRDLRFTIPELAQNRLASLEVPAGANYLHIAAGRGQGAQYVSAGAGPDSAKGLRLEADLGRVSTFHARWRQESGPVKPARVRVREAYLWDITASSASLYGVLQYTVTQGTAAAFALDLPEQAEVISVEVGRLPAPGAEENVPRLKDWQLSGSGQHRRVQFEFQRPVAGGVQLTLKLVLRQQLGPNALLPLPVPVDSPSTEGLIAYKVDGLSAEVAEHLRINGMNRDTFRETWKAAGMGDPGPATHAYSFQRMPAGPPLLRLRWQAPTSRASARQTIVWQVGSRQATLTANARVRALAGELSLVEWDFPATVQVAEVSGPQVRGWTRTGPRLQVWLRQSTSDVALQLTGWVPLSPVAGKILFDLPALHLHAVQSQTTFVRIRGSDNLVLEPVSLKNLWPLPDPRPSSQAGTFLTDQGEYGGVFQGQLATTEVEARLLTMAETRDGKLSFTTLVTCQPREGELRSITLRLGNWEADEVRLEAAQVVRRQERRRGDTERGWILELEPGITGRYDLKLSGTRSLSGAREILMPDVAIVGAARIDRWVALIPGEPRMENHGGLTPLTQWDLLQKTWPAETARLRRAGQVWQVRAADWRLPLPLGTTARGQAQVLFAEQAAASGDGRHWLHQGNYWIYDEGGSDLAMVMPSGSKVVSLALDGREVAPLRSTAKYLWVPLSGPAGPRFLSLTWTFDEDQEPTLQPNLTPPHFESVPERAVAWIVYVPAGFSTHPQEGQADPLSPARYHLLQGESQLRISQLLTERGPGASSEVNTAQLLAAQQRFYQGCRLAELQSVSDALTESALKDLRERNQLLAEIQGFEELRARAEQSPASFHAVAEIPPASNGEGSSKAVRGSLLPERGIPTYWLAPTGEAAPQLQLISSHVQDVHHARLVSAALAVLLLVSWSLPFFPRLLRGLRSLWPENLVLLGWLGWQVLGPGWICPFLILVGMCGRFLLLSQGAVKLLQRWTRAKAPAGSGSASS